MGGCLNLDFWTLGNEATIGYLRHAEIKHGRVAMAAFLGYLAQSTPVVSGPHAKLPYPGYETGLTPPEQWDAIPLAGKIQIFGIIGMLESYGEILPQHYCNGYIRQIIGESRIGQRVLIYIAKVFKNI